MNMSTAYPHLFSPFQLGSLTLPNRTVMAPMSTNLGSTRGAVTPEQLAFYRARAIGGTGMIVVEFCSVHGESGRSEHRQLTLESAAHIDGHQRLVDAIRSAGSVACLQLQHGGTQTSNGNGYTFWLVTVGVTYYFFQQKDGVTFTLETEVG